MRNPMAAMLNTSPSVVPGSWPMLISSSRLTPSSRHQPVKYFSMSSRGKRSMPAGTGVWVVKSVPGREAALASAKESPLSIINDRTRSRARKPAWPSFMWNTWGSRPRACKARVPPTPSTISWRIRSSTPPP